LDETNHSLDWQSCCAKWIRSEGWILHPYTSHPYARQLCCSNHSSLFIIIRAWKDCYASISVWNHFHSEL